MKWSVDQYIALPRETNRENNLKKTLRKLSDKEREDWTWELIEKTPGWGIEIASTCCRRKPFFEKILEKGLETSDVSQIYWWLDCVIPKLGFKKVLFILKDTLEVNPNAVARTLYWLPGFLDRKNKKQLAAYRMLFDLAKTKGIIKP